MPSKMKRKSANAAFGALLWVLAVALPAGVRVTFSGKCVGISDGDTISVMRESAAAKIRVEGIDCPELGQAFGNAAKRFTSNLVFGRVVQVKQMSVDQYGRIVGRAIVDGADLSLELLKAGLAWHYTQYSSDPILAAAERQARQAKIGLWSQLDPSPPWVFRRVRRK
jgi:micrococcal nuclease